MAPPACLVRDAIMRSAGIAGSYKLASRSTHRASGIYQALANAVTRLSAKGERLLATSASKLLLPLSVCILWQHPLHSEAYERHHHGTEFARLVDQCAKLVRTLAPNLVEPLQRDSPHDIMREVMGGKRLRAILDIVARHCTKPTFVPITTGYICEGRQQGSTQMSIPELMTVRIPDVWISKAAQLTMHLAVTHLVEPPVSLGDTATTRATGGPTSPHSHPPRIAVHCSPGVRTRQHQIHESRLPHNNLASAPSGAANLLYTGAVTPPKGPSSSTRKTSMDSESEPKRRLHREHLSLRREPTSTLSRQEPSPFYTRT
ncbi:hypothetical protein Purlil1_3337 [Purpureocillium lilacinum]|uniref:Rho-GAP domain-containing protein n=1 Tax=Purpureocillium lilacinum TaxID=33203 RepID=A0ABR0C6S7_PURLI|nr:hypothetical protein Purlil1_3337 [Purpureocillium lilacinum]